MVLDGKNDRFKVLFGLCIKKSAKTIVKETIIVILVTKSLRLL